MPFRCWCRYCVRGRSKDDHHSRGQPLEEEALPVMAMDYFYLFRGKGTEEVEEAEREGLRPNLAIVDQASNWWIRPTVELVDQPSQRRVGA